MKIIKHIFTHLTLNLLMITILKAGGPQPPADCTVKDPYHVYVFMHGGYKIQVSTSLNCYNRNQEEYLTKNGTADLWVAPGATVRIEAYTGVGSNTVNQFIIDNINGNYKIDCGGLMGSTNKCSWSKSVN